jgi:hypothetical protein
MCGCPSRRNRGVSYPQMGKTRSVRGGKVKSRNRFCNGQVLAFDGEDPMVVKRRLTHRICRAGERLCSIFHWLASAGGIC